MLKCDKSKYLSKNGYPDNFPPRKIAPRLGLGFGSRFGSALGWGRWATKQLPPRKIALWLVLGFGLGLVLGVGGGNFPRGQLS